MSVSNLSIKFVSAGLLASLLLTACGSAPATPAAAPAQSAPTSAAVQAAPAATTAPLVAPASEPTFVPAATAVPTIMPATMGTADFNGVTFNYDLALAQQITTTTVPGENAGPDGPYWATFPAYDEFNLVGYPSQNSYHKPHLAIYSVDEFSNLNAAAKEQIDQLKQLLGDAPGSPDKIPLIPIFNAAQVFRSQVKYLNFQSGQGVRFVTQYDQAIIPINNQETFYTFQGLTSDGRYYIAAILPVATGTLPATGELSQDQMQTFSTADGFENYLSQTVQTLNGLSASDFTPNLDLLDALIKSVRVEK
jgi:hypothetical protein